jgi:alpha-L-fucosidase
MLMNIAPATNGRLPALAVRRYKEFGGWLERCYNGSNTVAALDATSGASSPDWKKLQLDVKLQPAARLACGSTPQRLDRFVLMETIEGGQRIRAFHVTATIAGTGGTGSIDSGEEAKEAKEAKEVVVFNGTAVGHKLIGFFEQGALDGVSVLTVHLDEAYDGAGSLSLFKVQSINSARTSLT